MNTMIEKPYYALDYYLKQTFGEKIYKLALDGGMNCPNRDGTLGFGGCIFCSHGGSGDFAEPMRTSVTDQIERAKERVSHKIKQGRYIAYFQSYTNTYAPVSYLEPLFSEAIAHPDIVALSIGTRPDCLPPDVIELLSKLNKQKPVWIELGLQTIHETTAKNICRGYELPCFEDALIRLKKAGIDVIVHVILGLPGESREDMLDTIRYLSRLNPPIDGIKLQLLHILKDTKLAALYEAAGFPILSMNEYIDLVLDCIRLLPPDVVIHRLSGDGPKNLLIEPLWSGNKRLVLNSITKAFKDTGAYQGEYFNGLKG
ncbi:MAG: TIGR01212 family radical SAM protein [Clostridium sp.]